MAREVVSRCLTPRWLSVKPPLAAVAAALVSCGACESRSVCLAGTRLTGHEAYLIRDMCYVPPGPLAVKVHALLDSCQGYAELLPVDAAAAVASMAMMRIGRPAPVQRKPRVIPVCSDGERCVYCWLATLTRRPNWWQPPLTRAIATFDGVDLGDVALALATGAKVSHEWKAAPVLYISALRSDLTSYCVFMAPLMAYLSDYGGVLVCRGDGDAHRRLMTWFNG
jgi:hypothetical protein